MSASSGRYRRLGVVMHSRTASIQKLVGSGIGVVAGGEDQIDGAERAERLQISRLHAIEVAIPRQTGAAMSAVFPVRNSELTTLPSVERNSAVSQSS